MWELGLRAWGKRIYRTEEGGGGGDSVLFHWTARCLKEHESSFFTKAAIATVEQGRLRTHLRDSSTFMSFLRASPPTQANVSTPGKDVMHLHDHMHKRTAFGNESHSAVRFVHGCGKTAQPVYRCNFIPTRHRLTLPLSPGRGDGSPATRTHRNRTATTI